jgi:hypothetical protein
MNYHSPTIDILGSYFPAWIVCIVLGIIITIIVHLLLSGLGINAQVRAKPVVYSCATVFFAMALWLIFFQN